MKNTSLKHLFYALAAALAIPTAALAAAMPVVEWDGSVDVYNFANLTRTVGNNTYTLNLNPVGSANTVAADSSYIQIANADAQCGVTITTQNSNPTVTNGFGTSGTVTVLMKCRDMPVTAANNRAIISLMDGKKYKYGGTSQQDNGAVLGMYINTGTSGWMWKGSTAGNARLTGDYLNTVSGAFSADEQTVGLTYSYSNGGTAYYVNGSQIQSHSGLRASELAAPYGIALGGVDVSTGSQFYALKNMKIEAIAVFTSTLSAEEVANYKFLSTRSYSGAFPTVSGDFFTSTTVPTWITGDSWTGKLSISNVATANSLNLSLYGNTNSTIELTSIGTEDAWLAYGVTANAKVVLTDDGDTHALAINNGISRGNTTFRELAGTGTFSQNNSGITQGITINVMTNFTGKISPNKMTVTFGTAKRIGQRQKSDGTWESDPDTASKLYIDPDAVLSVPADFELWSPEAVEFNGTVNFTTNETDYEELVLFRYIGTRNTVTFGDNAVIKINGKEYDKSLYFIRIKNSNLVLCKKHIFTMYVR